jgi:hypothetical protein
MATEGPTHVHVQGQHNPKDPNSKTASHKTTVISEPCIDTCKTAIKVAIGTFAVIVCSMLVIRTSTLVIVPLLELLAENPCSLNSTSTVQFTSMVYSSSSEYIRRLSVIMTIIITVLQWPAHGYLFYYLYRFFAQKYPAWQQANLVEEGRYKWTSFVCRQRCKGVLVVLSLSVLTITSVITISGDIVKLARERDSLGCEYPTPSLYARRILTYVYYATTFFTYMLEVAERYLMVCFTAFVGAMWHDGYETRKKQMESVPPNHQNNEQQQQTTNGYVDEFNKIVDCVKPIYKIFRSFFVFQWLVHVYLLFTQLVHLLYPWIKKGRNSFTDTTESDTSSTLHSNAAAVIFYILALLTAYVCGLKMNSYRRRYIRKARLIHQELLQHDRENKSIFTPRVPGMGLSISLESPGYMLGVVLTMFGLVGALLSM